MATADEPLCARCAKVQRTCCQTREIYVTPGDERRIAAHTGGTGFTTFAHPQDPDYLDQDDDPEWYRVFRDDGARRVLKRKVSGDCTFLGERGCTLPLEVRPLACRLYPFDYSGAGLRDELSHMCPTRLLPPGVPLLRVLDMEVGDGERWRAQLYREIQDEPNPAVAPSQRGSEVPVLRPAEDLPPAGPGIDGRRDDVSTGEGRGS